MLCYVHIQLTENSHKDISQIHVPLYIEVAIHWSAFPHLGCTLFALCLMTIFTQCVCEYANRLSLSQCVPSCWCQGQMRRISAVTFSSLRSVWHMRWAPAQLLFQTLPCSSDLCSWICISYICIKACEALWANSIFNKRNRRANPRPRLSVLHFCEILAMETCSEQFSPRNSAFLKTEIISEIIIIIDAVIRHYRSLKMDRQYLIVFVEA